MVNEIDELDVLWSSTPSTTGRPIISVNLTLTTDQSATDEISKNIQILGPGDVKGFNPGAIIKVAPQAGSRNFEQNYLAHIEFYDEDLPWRYTPASPNGHKLRPWLWLLALKEDEFKVIPRSVTRPLPSIKIETTASKALDLEPGDAFWWAHVQVNKRLDADGTDLEAVRTELSQYLAEDPDLALSRIVCPRKLDPDTRYFMFLVPLFEAGRRAGLATKKEDIDLTGVKAQQAAWQKGDTDIEFPVYYQWDFHTAEDGDFETLARKLEPKTLEDFSLPNIDITDLVESLQGDTDQATNILDFGAALMPPNQTITPWPVTSNTKDSTVRTNLIDRLNQNSIINESPEDPVVNVPPIYGKWHQGLEAIAASGTDWIHQLNLDPRYRVIAYLGGEVMRKYQEQFMDEAWEQVGEIEAANRKLRQTQFALEVNSKLLKKTYHGSAKHRPGCKCCRSGRPDISPARKDPYS